MSDGTAFSVVVPVYDAVEHLPELCERLARLDDPPGGYEVLFVDDRSRDRSLEYLLAAAEGEPRFRVLRCEGRGPAAARNLAIAAARGRFVAFTDPDTLPDRGWLAGALRALSETHARALEGAVVPEPGALSSPLVRHVENTSGGKFMTANMVYERALLLEVGGFDETFRPPPFLEDSDLAFRVLDLGVPIPFSPDARVRHRTIELTPMSYVRYQARLQWLPLLARKHPRRYRSQLRPHVQAFRPGDAALSIALVLLPLGRRGDRLEYALTWCGLAVALRRVTRAAGVIGVPPGRRLRWTLAALVGWVARVAYLAAGAIRFRALPR